MSLKNKSDTELQLNIAHEIDWASNFTHPKGYRVFAVLTTGGAYEYRTGG